MKRPAGFTLVEAMVIVAIVAIIASVAMPSFLESIRSARTRNTSDQIVQLLNFTRSESLNKNANHIFSVEDTGLCVTRKGEDQCAVKLETIPSGVTVTAMLSTLAYSPCEPYGKRVKWRSLSH